MLVKLKWLVNCQLVIKFVELILDLERLLTMKLISFLLMKDIMQKVVFLIVIFIEKIVPYLTYLIDLNIEMVVI